MAQSIVDAVAAIKRNVAACLSASSIQRICHAENYRCRVRQLGPVTTLHAFLLQVLHGNAACSQVVAGPFELYDRSLLSGPSKNPAGHLSATAG